MTTSLIRRARLTDCLGGYQKMLARHTFVLCTLVAVLCVSSESSRADMLVASRATNEILRYDETTGEYLGVFASHSRLNQPELMVFGPDGKLYVTTNNFYTDENIPYSVLRFDGQTGAFVDEFIESGVTGIAFGADGKIYAAGNGSSTIARFDGTSGAFIDFFSTGVYWPGQLQFGSDGNLYVPSWPYDQVLRFNGTTGESMGVFASGGGLDDPEGMTFGPDGNLYVSSFETDSVLRYNGATGAFIDVFASGNGMLGPAGLAFGPDGNLYVGQRKQYANNRVLRFNGTTGAFIDEFVSGGRLSDPMSIVFTPTESDPTDLIVDLMQEVVALNLKHGIANSLDAKLDHAFDALMDSATYNDISAVNSLDAFINAVNAQRGKAIPAADADALIAAAEDIIDLLE